MSIILESGTEDLSLNLTISKELRPYLEKVYWVCKEWDETIEAFIIRKIKELSLDELAQYEINTLQQSIQENMETWKISIEAEVEILKNL